MLVVNMERRGWISTFVVEVKSIVTRCRGLWKGRDKSDSRVLA